VSEETASASTPAEDGGALVEVGTGLRESVEALTLALRAAESKVTSRQQDETRSKVLCPLYQVLLTASTHPTSTTPGSPAQQAQFEKAVATIKTGYTTLGCTPALSPVLPSG
jgi:hypothetical protein